MIKKIVSVLLAALLVSGSFSPAYCAYKKYGKVYPQGTFSADCFVKVYENTLGTAATSVTISGLDGNTDVMYRLITRVVNGYSGSVHTFLRPNNDSGGTNYGSQYLSGSNTLIDAGRDTTEANFYINFSSALDDISLGNTLLYAKSGYVRTALINTLRYTSGTTVGAIILYPGVWNNTADNITSLVIASGQASGLGVGTYIALYRKVAKQ